MYTGCCDTVTDDISAINKAVTLIAIENIETLGIILMFHHINCTFVLILFPLFLLLILQCYNEKKSIACSLTITVSFLIYDSKIVQVIGYR